MAAAPKKDCADWTKLSQDDIRDRSLMATVPEWKLVEDASGMLSLELAFRAKDFDASVAYINAVGVIANRINHHPDLHIESFRNVRIAIYTYSLKGVTDLDFLLAQTIDMEVPRS